MKLNEYFNKTFLLVYFLGSGAFCAEYKISSSASSNSLYFVDLKSLGVFNQVTIDMGVDFQSSSICSNKTIFGKSGTAGCAIGYNLYSVLPTGMHRTDNVNTIVGVQAYPASRATQQLKVGDEWSNSLGGSAKLRIVPDPTYDHDGYGNAYGGNAGAHDFQSVYGGRPTNDCGLVGSVATRIADCATQNPGKNYYDGARYGQGTEGAWSLVTRWNTLGYVNEVWRDEKTQLIWGDEIRGDFSAENGTFVFGGEGMTAAHSIFNWYMAAGYATAVSLETTMIDRTTAATVGKPFSYFNGGTGCTGVVGSCAKSVQPSTPISLCAEAPLIAGANGVATYNTPAATLPSKGGITSSDGVYWKLPTRNDFFQADLDGIRKVIPNVTGVFFWTWNFSSNLAGYAMTYYADRGTGAHQNRDGSGYVRCVGAVQ